MLLNNRNQIVHLPHSRNQAEKKALEVLLASLREVLVPSTPYPYGMFSIQKRFKLKGASK